MRPVWPGVEGGVVFVFVFVFVFVCVCVCVRARVCVSFSLCWCLCLRVCVCVRIYSTVRLLSCIIECPAAEAATNKDNCRFRIHSTGAPRL